MRRSCHTRDNFYKGTSKVQAMVMLLTVLLIICAHFRHVASHIVLTFPPARYPPLDFLDNSRTPAPCGVPRPSNSSNNRLTNLKAGETYNITWRMNYPHQAGLRVFGGYVIDIIDDTGKQLYTLTPQPWSGAEDQTRQWQLVTIPASAKCTNCILRLQRQAVEWSSYRFWTCADVNILTATISAAQLSNCFGRGIPDQAASGQTCNCNPHYEGAFCQYQDDCSTDADCSNSGKCLPYSLNYPRHACYCRAPFHGKHCERKFQPTPEDIKQKCFNYALTRVGAANASASPFREFGVFNADCYAKTMASPTDIIYWRLVNNAEIEIVLRYQTSSFAAIGWRPDDITSKCQTFPTDVGGAGSRAPPEPEATAGGHHSLKPRENANAEPTHRAQSAAAEPEPEPEAEPKADSKDGPLDNAMDCTDIVVGSARGDHSRIGDYYTRDRSTPLADENYFGDDSLTAAAGFNTGDSKNPVTIIMFRKPLKATERADHSIAPGRMLVIWAKGQTPGDYKHSAVSGLDIGGASVKNFYDTDELKYHGSRNRGILKLDFIGGSQAQRSSGEATSGGIFGVTLGVSIACAIHRL